MEKVSQAIVGNVPYIDKVEYEKYHRADKNWTQEYVVVRFKGGAIGVRNVSSTSCGAIFQERGLSKPLPHKNGGSKEPLFIASPKPERSSLIGVSVLR